MSIGNLDLPSKGTLKAKRLVEGFKDESFGSEEWVEVTVGRGCGGGDEIGVDGLDGSSSMESGMEGVCCNCGRRGGVCGVNQMERRLDGVLEIGVAVGDSAGGKGSTAPCW